MAMMPKRVKFRKSQRGKIRGVAQRGNEVSFGDYGLQALQGGWIRANVIAPGNVLTPMNEHLRALPGYEERVSGETPAGRFGEPEEIAAAVVFFASDAASFVHGASLLVDGGWIAR